VGWGRRVSRTVARTEPRGRRGLLDTPSGPDPRSAGDLKVGHLPAAPRTSELIMDITLTPEPCRVIASPMPMGTVFEGPLDAPEGRTVDARPPLGGRSLSKTNSTGDACVDLSGPLDVGRQNEPRVLKTLIQKLREGGAQVSRLEGAVDADGEDGRLKIDGRDTVVQVVSMPPNGPLWRDLVDRGKSSWSGSRDEVVQFIRKALDLKRPKAAGSILVLDASHMGAPIGPRLVSAYLEQHGPPEAEFPFEAVWIVGPTVGSTIRLGA